MFHHSDIFPSENTGLQLSEVWAQLGTGDEMTGLIDAELMQASLGIRGAVARIQDTVFADVEPFDPEQFITDVVCQ